MNGLVSRLAPSPTGGQHLGNARTFLINWLAVRRAGGRLLLRIEDIDSPRVKPGADQQLLDDLRWLGLDWDGEPVWQSRRLCRYEAALESLKAAELVYPCTCTRKDIELAASAPHLEHEGPRYPGTCARHRVADAARLADDRPIAWRFRATDTGQQYIDGFLGPQSVPAALGGDFVVWKANNTPAYQLAVVVDDAEQGINLVVRGDDLVPSTPRQLQLYAALGALPPQFCHVPLVKGPDGLRLAKRHGDGRLATFRELGISPEMVLGFLAWTCRWQTQPVAQQAAELLKLFTWDNIPREPWVLTPEHLAFLERQTAGRTSHTIETEIG